MIQGRVPSISVSEPKVKKLMKMWQFPASVPSWDTMLRVVFPCHSPPSPPPPSQLGMNLHIFWKLIAAPGVKAVNEETEQVQLMIRKPSVTRSSIKAGNVILMGAAAWSMRWSLGGEGVLIRMAGDYIRLWPEGTKPHTAACGDHEGQLHIHKSASLEAAPLITL